MKSRWRIKTWPSVGSKFSFALLFVATVSGAVTPWPEPAKQSYVARCSASMAGQGMPAKTSQDFCSCIASGMSNEFGMEEQNQVMAAQPNSSGSAIDRRLYKIFSNCGSAVKK